MKGKVSLHKLKRILNEKYNGFRVSSDGNLFTPLISSYDIYNEFYSAINNARKSINMEFYIFQADRVGVVFTDLLCKKAKEGILVNVILDFVGSYPFKGRLVLYNKMIASGVNLRFSLRFSDMLKSVWYNKGIFRRSGVRGFFKRNHRKILVVDGEVAYTGGANIGEEYLSSSLKSNSWRDFQFKIVGPAVNTLQFTFFRSWIREGGIIKKKNIHYFFRKQPILKKGICIKVMTNAFGNQGKLLRSLVRDIKSARKYIYIENPYILNPIIINALCKASRRGVRVAILTSLDRLDIGFLRILVERVLFILHKAKVKIFIYPNTFLHGKAILIDDRVAIVGSANLNNRSFLWDYELNLEVFDKKVLLKMKKDIFEKDLAISSQFGKEGMKFFSKLKYFFINFLEKFS